LRLKNGIKTNEKTVSKQHVKIVIKACCEGFQEAGTKGMRVSPCRKVCKKSVG
jgi:hypothetical protein